MSDGSTVIAFTESDFNDISRNETRLRKVEARVKELEEIVVKLAEPNRPGR